MLRDKLYRVYKRRFVIGIRKGKIRLVDRLFNAIKLPSRLKRPSRDYLQKDVLLLLIVSSYPF